MKKLNSIESLKNFGETHSVNDVLCKCFGVSEYTKLLLLLCNDLSPLLEAWSYDNNTDVGAILDAIELNLGSVGRLRVEEYADLDGWVDCELKLDNNISIRFSWDLQENQVDD